MLGPTFRLHSPWCVLNWLYASEECTNTKVRECRACAWTANKNTILCIVLHIMLLHSSIFLSWCVLFWNILRCSEVFSRVPMCPNKGNRCEIHHRCNAGPLTLTIQHPSKMYKPKRSQKQNLQHGHMHIGTCMCKSGTTTMAPFSNADPSAIYTVGTACGGHSHAAASVSSWSKTHCRHNNNLHMNEVGRLHVTKRTCCDHANDDNHINCVWLSALHAQDQL